ncbi:MAG: hypothetical protein ACRDH9_12435 [Actinomycetota bacterium]
MSAAALLSVRPSASIRRFTAVLVQTIVLFSFLGIVGVNEAKALPLSFEDVNPNQADTDAADPDRASGGRVNGLAIASGNNQVIYAASEWGGLYRTTNGGLNWAHLPGHNPMATWDVDIDPSDNSRVYATSQYDGRATGSLSGIEVSTDSGATWTKPASATPPGAYSCAASRVSEPAAFGISIRPDAPSNVFIGTNCGLARSTDSGATWTFINPAGGFAQTINDVVAQVGGDVDVCGETGHWHSEDNGATWDSGSGLPSGTCSIVASPDESYVLFAVVGTSLFELTDAQTDADNNGSLDTAWVGMGPNPSRQGRIPFFATNARGGNGGRDFNLWFGDVSLHFRNCTTPASPALGGATRCPAPAAANNGVDDDGNGDDLDGDGTVETFVDEPDEGWIGRPGGLPGDQANGNGRAFTRPSGAHDDAGDIVFDSAVAVDACPEVFSSDGGVYYNTDNGADCVHPDWEQPNVTPHALWPFAFAGFNRAGMGEDLYMGLQDNGVFAANMAGDPVAANVQADWHIDACCDGFDNVSDGNRVVRTRCCGFSIAICDVGYTACTALTNANNPPGCCPQFRFPDFIDTIGDKQYVAATGQGLFFTTDITAGAVTWTEVGGAGTSPNGLCAVSTSFSAGTPTFYAWVGSCRPDNSNQIWSYTGTGAGDTWDRIDNNDGLPGGFGIFAGDRNDPNRLYASHLGAATPQMVFSTDGGANWTRDMDLEAMMTGNGAYKMQTVRGPDNFTLEDTTDGYVQPSLLQYSPENGNIIAAGGVDSGVFISSNGGGDWALVNDPNSTNNTTPHLPRPRFAYFDHEPAGNVRLFTASQGRGIWRINLANADLAMDKSDSADPVVAGTNLTYTLDVTNNGVDAAGNVTATDPLPPETTFQSISAPGWSCMTPAAGTNGTVTCTRASLAALATSSISITVKVDPATPDGTTLSDTASVASNAIDTNTANNSDTETTEVIARADMELVSKTDSQDPAFAGETLTYTIEVRNNGPSTAVDARVIDMLPSGVTYQSDTDTCVEGPSGTLTCSFGELDPGDSETFSITVFIARDLVYNNGAPITITNTATADSDTEDPDASNDQRIEDTLVKAKADLEILSFEAQNPPSELIIGEPKTVTLHKVITNNGPSAPMDVRVVRTASSTPNATVNPSMTSHVETALGYQEERDVDEDFEIECTAPGKATFTFNNEISPERPDDIDPDMSNNTAEESFTVDCIVPVAINIKPGSFRNPLNLKSNGVIPLAVLTTEAGEYGLPLAFDATTIHPNSVRFGPEAVVIAGGGAHESHGRGHIEDAIERSDEKTRDGDLDMVLHFRTQESELNGTETVACVRGEWGPMHFLFHGCDVVDFVP